MQTRGKAMQAGIGAVVTRERASGFVVIENCACGVNRKHFWAERATIGEIDLDCWRCPHCGTMYPNRTMEGWQTECPTQFR
jgi:hypothetical protein